MRGRTLVDHGENVANPEQSSKLSGSEGGMGTRGEVKLILFDKPRRE